MSLEALLRRVAAGIVDAKDGVTGIHRAKRGFSQLLSKTEAELREYSLDRLRRILVHAYHTTLYYRRLFDEVGFYPQKMRDFSDINVVPTLSRQALQDNERDLISDQFARASLTRSYTGGTNGTPVAFFRDEECLVQRLGRRLKILELCGYHRSDRCAWIWGAHVDLDARPQKRWRDLKGRLRKFAVGKETLCCTSLTPELMEEYYHRLVRFKPKVMYGYPNAMTYFAEFAKKRNLRQIEVETIVCTAERLTENQRRKLKDVFGGEVYNMYATREHGFIGFECNRHRGFHIDSGNVFLEIIKDGKPVPAGESGEVVLTDLCNFGMPFVRYRIGDVGRISIKRCECRSPLPVLESFDGRTADAVFRPDGKRVDGVMLVDLFSDNKSVQAMQIVQQRLEGIDLNLVITPHYDNDAEQQILREVKQFMGNESNIAIHHMKDIPRNPRSGKYQHVICRVSPAADSIS